MLARSRSAASWARAAGLVLHGADTAVHDLRNHLDWLEHGPQPSAGAERPVLFIYGLSSARCSTWLNVNRPAACGGYHK
jgi:hypothetical protein